MTGDIQPSHPSVTPPEPARQPDMLTPVRETERIHSLDVLRGFAIFGILMVNMQLFAMPLAEMIDPTGMADATKSERIVYSCSRAFFEYKFVSLFSLLFGVGLIIQMTRTEAKGKEFVLYYLKRTIILAVIGLCHALLIWYGDILFIYSFVALLMILFRKLSPRAMLLWAGGAFVLSVVLLAGMTSLGVAYADQAAEAKQKAAEAREQRIADQASEGPDAEEPPSKEPLVVQEDEDTRWDRFISEIKHIRGGPAEDPAWAEAEAIAFKEGPFLSAFIMRAILFAGMLIIPLFFGGFLPRVIAMFLIGMAMMKCGFFKQENRRWHVMMCVLGLGIGIPGELFLVWTYYQTGYTLEWLNVAGEVAHQFGSFALCFGYVGTILLLHSSRFLKWLMRGFAAVGRTALTNYLLQSVVATSITYWWGLAYFNEIDRMQQVALVLIMYVGQMIVSVIWLRMFTMGPVEWLWRSLAYARLQSIIRR